MLHFPILVCWYFHYSHSLPNCHRLPVSIDFLDDLDSLGMDANCPVDNLLIQYNFLPVREQFNTVWIFRQVCTITQSGDQLIGINTEDRVVWFVRYTTGTDWSSNCRFMVMFHPRIQDIDRRNSFIFNPQTGPYSKQEHSNCKQNLRARNVKRILHVNQLRRRLHLDSGITLTNIHESIQQDLLLKSQRTSESIQWGYETSADTFAATRILQHTEPERHQPVCRWLKKQLLPSVPVLHESIPNSALQHQVYPRGTWFLFWKHCHDCQELCLQKLNLFLDLWRASHSRRLRRTYQENLDDCFQLRVGDLWASLKNRPKIQAWGYVQVK